MLYGSTSSPILFYQNISFMSWSRCLKESYGVLPEGCKEGAYACLGQGLPAYIGRKFGIPSLIARSTKQEVILFIKPLLQRRTFQNNFVQPNRPLTFQTTSFFFFFFNYLFFIFGTYMQLVGAHVYEDKSFLPPHIQKETLIMHGTTRVLHDIFFSFAAYVWR